MSLDCAEVAEATPIPRSAVRRPQRFAVRYAEPVCPVRRPKGMRLLPSVRITSDRGRGALTPAARPPPRAPSAALATAPGRPVARAGPALGMVATIALPGGAAQKQPDQPAGS